MPGVTFTTEGAVAYTGSGVRPSDGAAAGRAYDDIDFTTPPPPGTVLFDGPITPQGFGYAATGPGQLWLDVGAGGEVYRINPGNSDDWVTDQAFAPGTRTLVKGSASIFDPTPLFPKHGVFGVFLKLRGSLADEDNVMELAPSARADSAIGFAPGVTVGPFDDSSGNGHHLSQQGASVEPTVADSYDVTRFGQGWYMPVGRNSSTNLVHALVSSVGISNFAVTIGFDFDGFDESANGGLFYCHSSGSMAVDTPAAWACSRRNASEELASEKRAMAMRALLNDER